MWILPERGQHLLLCEMLHELEGWMANSRFSAHIAPQWMRGTRLGIKIKNVRLRNRKDYCGAHPGPCLVNPLRSETPHKATRLLEGLDWVGFNHMLNDWLDEREQACTVFSYNRESMAHRYYIRRGRRRRVKYPFETEMNSLGFAQFAHWTQSKEDLEDTYIFQDHCGRPHPSVDEDILQSGTPGIACYTLEEEAETLAQWASR